MWQNWKQQREYTVENNKNIDRAAVNAADGFALAVGAAPERYLGNPDAVEKLVREFMALVFNSRATWHKDGDGAGAEARINSACKRCGAVIMGRSSTHDAQPWNSPARLGVLLRSLLADTESFGGDPGEAYFHFLAAQALNAAIAIEEGMAEEDVKKNTSEVVQDAIEVILGRRATVAA